MQLFLFNTIMFENVRKTPCKSYKATIFNIMVANSHSKTISFGNQFRHDKSDIMRIKGHLYLPFWIERNGRRIQSTQRYRTKAKFFFSFGLVGGYRLPFLENCSYPFRSIVDFQAERFKLLTIHSVPSKGKNQTKPNNSKKSHRNPDSPSANNGIIKGKKGEIQSIDPVKWNRSFISEKCTEKNRVNDFDKQWPPPNPTSYTIVGVPIHPNSTPIDVEAATQRHLQTLQADCKYNNFNADTNLAYMLAQNSYSQDTKKRLFLSHTTTLDVYVNIMQAAESAESSFATIHKDSKDVHAVRNNSHRHSNRYLNRGRDQSLNLSKHPQSPTSFNNTEIAGLRGQFTATIEYNGLRAKVTLLVLDTIKVATWGTDTIEALQLVIDVAT
uniref:Uncharacterized protein n=1 Tax=Romanomermis culicivorax TaxID=13658 RepID=A0A915ICA4_ROMCU